MKSTLVTTVWLICIFPVFAQTGLLVNWEKEFLNTSGPEVVKLIKFSLTNFGIGVSITRDKF